MQTKLFRLRILSVVLSSLPSCKSTQPAVSPSDPPVRLTFISTLEEFRIRRDTTKYLLRNLLNENVTKQDVIDLASNHMFTGDYVNLWEPVGVPPPKIIKGVNALENYCRWFDGVPENAKNLSAPQQWEFLYVLNEGDNRHIFGFDPSGKLRPL